MSSIYFTYIGILPYNTSTFCFQRRCGTTLSQSFRISIDLFVLFQIPSHTIEKHNPPYTYIYINVQEHARISLRPLHMYMFNYFLYINTVSYSCFLLLSVSPSLRHIKNRIEIDRTEGESFLPLIVCLSIVIPRSTVIPRVFHPSTRTFPEGDRGIKLAI